MFAHFVINPNTQEIEIDSKQNKPGVKVTVMYRLLKTDVKNKYNPYRKLEDFLSISDTLNPFIIKRLLNKDFVYPKDYHPVGSFMVIDVQINESESVRLSGKSYCRFQDKWNSKEALKKAIRSCFRNKETKVLVENYGAIIISKLQKVITETYMH